MHTIMIIIMNRRWKGGGFCYAIRNEHSNSGKMIESLCLTESSRYFNKAVLKILHIHNFKVLHFITLRSINPFVFIQELIKLAISK